jgi:hypothetical protein
VSSRGRRPKGAPESKILSKIAAKIAAENVLENAVAKGSAQNFSELFRKTLATRADFHGGVCHRDVDGRRRPRRATAAGSVPEAWCYGGFGRRLPRCGLWPRFEERRLRGRWPCVRGTRRPKRAPASTWNALATLLPLFAARGTTTSIQSSSWPGSRRSGGAGPKPKWDPTDGGAQFASAGGGKPKLPAAQRPGCGPR